MPHEIGYLTLVENKQQNQSEPLVTQDDPNSLVERIGQNRDKAAFAILFKQFGLKLKSLMFRLGTNTSTAEELV